MAFLTEEQCVPCRQGSPPATAAERNNWMKKLPEWKIEATDGIPELKRIFEFENFREALDFTVKVGTIAEQEDHHPSILLEWGRVAVRWSTHKIKNLHRNDFVMAAKTDGLYGR